MAYVGAIDQGTTSTRFAIVDHTGAFVGMAQKEHAQLMPQPGWVEHDATEIWANTEEVIAVIPSPVDFVRSVAWEDKALWVGTRKQQLVRVDPDDGSVLSNSPVPSKRMSELKSRFEPEAQSPTITPLAGPKRADMIIPIPN